MNRDDAKAALLEMGIKNPSRSLVENYLRANSQQQPEEPTTEPTATEQAPASPHPSSESNLEPTLRERGELVRPAGRRKAGRPRIIASFYPALAKVMADQTPLPEALRILGIHLDKRQQRALYRNRAFKAMYQEARRQYLRQWPTLRQKRSKRPKGCRGRDCLGPARAFLRKL